MILRICFGFIFIFTSLSVRADVSDAYIRACKALVTLVKDGNANSKALGSYAAATFAVQDGDAIDLKKYGKAMEFIISIQKTNLLPQKRFEECNKEIRDKFKKEDLLDTSPTSDQVANLSSTELEASIPVNQNQTNEVKKLPNQQRPSKVNCSYDSNDGCEETETNGSQAILPLEELNLKMSGSLTKTFSEKDCQCFRQKLLEEKKNENKIMSQSSEEFNRVNKLIVQATAKKFLNEFAAFHEDLIYYENTKGGALQKNSNLKLDKSLLCTESESFKSSIDVACKANNTIAGKDGRMSEIFGPWGYNLEPGKDGLQKGINDLIVDIESTSSTYSRAKFDKYRFGLGNLVDGQPEVILLDELTAQILQDRNLKSDLKKYMDGGASPLVAIEMILSSSTDKNSIMKLFQKVKNPKCKDLISKLSKTNGLDFDKERGRIFDIGLNMHPGLKMLMNNRALLEKAASKMDEDSRGIIESAESNFLFAGHFTDRCKELQKNLAEAICTDRSALKDKVNKQDLIHLLNMDVAIDDKHADAIDLFICSTNKNKVVSGSAFDGLVIDDRRNFNVSDYYSKQQHKSSFFSNSALLSKDPVFDERMNMIATAFEYERVSTGKSSIADAVNKPYFNEDEFMAGVKQKISGSKDHPEGFVVPKESTSFAETTDSNSSSGKSITSNQVKTNAFNSELIKGLPQTFQASTLPGVDEPKVQQVSTPLTQLKEIFSGDQAAIRNNLEHINNNDAQELLELRKQLSKGKDEITNLRLEQETRKTQELRDQYNSLSKRFDILSKERSDTPGRTISGLSDLGQGFKNSNFVFSNDKNTISESKGPSEAKVAFAQNGIASNNQAAANRDTSKTDNNILVDSQNNGLTGHKLVITSKMQDGKKVTDDPSGELISYLMNNEADSKTLKELKESGMIYTYDLDDNGKIIQVSKLIKYNQLSIEAKTMVDNKLKILSIQDTKSLNELENDVIQAHRKYSYQVLKLEILKAK